MGIGMGFKETMLIFTPICLFLQCPWKKRFKLLALCLVTCVGVRLLIDVFAQQPFFWMETKGTVDFETEETRFKLVGNLRNLIVAFCANSLFLLNGGTTLLLLLLPTAGNRLALGFKGVAVLFMTGLFLFAAILEFRIWFELIPLGLYNIHVFLQSREAEQPALLDVPEVSHENA
ncbi:MAG: hypothetical protein AAF492_13035 [Verrucomicrobiota bacterium]